MDHFVRGDSRHSSVGRLGLAHPAKPCAKKVAVIGAGPAGMTAAYELVRGGADVEVFEATDFVGGMSRSFDLWGQRVDLGPHRFFTADPRVNRLWFEVVGDDYRMVDRLTRLYYQRRFFYYPLQATNALWNMGLYEASRCTASYLREKLVPSTGAGGDDSFESWVVGRFGRRLFEMFFKSYSEKLWGIACGELDADFAAQRIKKFSLGEAAKTALGINKNRHTTLVDRFAYPVEGTGMVYQRMADYVRQGGGQVHLNAPVRRVLCNQRTWHVQSSDDRAAYETLRVEGVELADGRRRSADCVISTMPLTSLVQGLDDVPPDVQQSVDRLTYRNTILTYLHVEGTDLFPDQWLYVHAPELRTGRITNFRNWVPTLHGQSENTILALEYWCYDHDSLWSEPDAQLLERASREIRETGLLRDARVLEGHVVRIRRSYPVYRRGYKEHVSRIMQHLHRISGLSAIGRYGAFKYNNQDHSILTGILAAENILRGRQHDLGSINTDYESYQESASIEPMRRTA